MLKHQETKSCNDCPHVEGNIWDGLEGKQLQLLQDYRIESQLDNGQMLFHETHRCHGLHCIASGLLALRKTDDEGNSVILRLVHPGESLGFPAYFGQMTYTATAEALSTCRICFFPKRVIDELLDQVPWLKERFMKLLADELRQYGEARLAAATRPLQDRMISLLLELEPTCGSRLEDGSLKLDLPISRRDIAAMLGIRPETVARAIRHLSENDIAQFDGRRVLIPNPTAHRFEAH